MEKQNKEQKLIKEHSEKQRDILFQVGLTLEDQEMDYIIKPEIKNLELRALASYLESIVTHLKWSFEIRPEDEED